MLDLAAFAAQFEASGLGAAMRGGVRNLYGLVNIAHVFGAILLVGGIGVVDLRILGFGRRVPLGALSRMLTPLAVAGLLIQLISGVMLFSADAAPLFASKVFRIKVALVVFGLVNALLFRKLFGNLETEPDSPVAKLLAGASLVSWLTVAGLGRWIAYV